ncbi:amidohydrolase family protein [Nocardioides mangrovi]|uniref:Amidohydrolase family protein n=1 Tax=Nocardioides mangrovi TaxID=2874580 RepID=A0ABS7UEV6_9ACTN|nr:amidohydrolase family protein [Nocardioides mangrovi]MBZ5739538.1 amidohydrolase family protein [Nocardioides mangrovi]
MSSRLIVNARVFDGTGTPARPAEVLVEGNRIRLVADRVDDAMRAGAEVIDGAGTVLMPGLVDGHTHLGFGSTVEHLSDRREPDEEKALLIAHAGRVMLDHGFTSCYSGGNRLPQAEVSARKAFAEGWLPGPRLRACSWEGSAGMVSPGNYDFPGIDHRASDPESIRVFVNAMADLGVDCVKLSLTGESAVVAGTSRIMQFTEEEVSVAAETARDRGVWLTAHAHSAEAIRLAVQYGIRAVYHATFADDEAIEALVEARDRVFVAPTPGIIWAHLHDMEHPPTEGMETQETFESVCRVAPELHKRGVRLVIGGDYGFPINQVGRNARDLRLFVEWFGMTPAEALQCATQNGGAIMGMEDELGLVREGYLADLLLVEGDPTTDISLMEDRAHLAMVMKDGRLHRLDPARRVAVTG